MELTAGYRHTEIGHLPQDWTCARLGEEGLVTRVGSGITPTGGERVYKSIGRPFIRSQNVRWGTLDLEGV